MNLIIFIIVLKKIFSFYNIRAFSILDSWSKIKFSDEIIVKLDLIEAFFLYFFISDDDMGSVSTAKSVSTGFSIIWCCTFIEKRSTDCC